MLRFHSLYLSCYRKSAHELKLYQAHSEIKINTASGSSSRWLAASARVSESVGMDMAKVSVRLSMVIQRAPLKHER